MSLFLISPSPLALYVFTTDKSIQDLFLTQTGAGSACINDTIMQFGGEFSDVTDLFQVLVIWGGSQNFDD